MTVDRARTRAVLRSIDDTLDDVALAAAVDRLFAHPSMTLAEADEVLARRPHDVDLERLARELAPILQRVADAFAAFVDAIAGVAREYGRMLDELILGLSIGTPSRAHPPRPLPHPPLRLDPKPMPYVMPPRLHRRQHR